MDDWSMAMVFVSGNVRVVEGGYCRAIELNDRQGGRYRVSISHQRSRVLHSNARVNARQQPRSRRGKTASVLEAWR